MLNNMKSYLFIKINLIKEQRIFNSLYSNRFNKELNYNIFKKLKLENFIKIKNFFFFYNFLLKKGINIYFFFSKNSFNFEKILNNSKYYNAIILLTTDLTDSKFQLIKPLNLPIFTITTKKYNTFFDTYQLNIQSRYFELNLVYFLFFIVKSYQLKIYNLKKYIFVTLYNVIKIKKLNE